MLGKVTQKFLSAKNFYDSRHAQNTVPGTSGDPLTEESFNIAVEDTSSDEGSDSAVSPVPMYLKANRQGLKTK